MKGAKWIAAALTLLLLTLPITGCGFKDIDKRFFVVTMGIDQPDEGEGFKVTLRLAVPSPKTEPGAAMSQIETIQATTIAEAVRLVKSHVDKELDFGHCKIFVLGEKLMKENYRDVMEWINRRRDVQAVSYLAVGRPDANSIVKVQPPNERYPGNSLFLAFGSDGTDSSYSLSVYSFDFARRVGELGMDPVLPLIRKEKEAENYYITRIALLNKSKMVLLLTPQETQLYNQIANRFRKSTVRARINDKEMVIALNEVTSHFNIVGDGEGGHKLKLRLDVSGIFEEAPVGIYKEDWGKIEAQFDEQVAKEIEKMLVKIQKAGVDPFGFGLRYRAKHAGKPSTWEAWQKIYPELTFDIKVDTHIEGTGLVQ